jgi:hypothetical protein
MASTACQRTVNKGVVFYVKLAKCSVDACLLVLCFFRSYFVSIFTFTFTTRPCYAIPPTTAHPQTLKTSAAACNKTHASIYVFVF